MGTVTKSIGTASRNYSTQQAWEDALPASLTADGNAQVGELYADSEFVTASGNILTISGITTDATNTLTLRAAAGQSFKDHASKTSNRLAYDATKGVAIRTTGSYDISILSTVNNLTIEGIQLKSTGSPNRGLRSQGTNALIKNCILQAKPFGNTDNYTLTVEGGNVVNTLLIVDTANACSGLLLLNNASAYNVTVARASNYTAGGAAITSKYGTSTIKNCALFGFTSNSGTFNADGHNVTDMATAPGTTSNLTSKTYSAQFVQTSTGSSVEDFRAASSGSDLAVAGARDATNTADLDIIGQSRSTSAPTVGAWEVISGGGPASYSYTASGGFVLSGSATKVRGTVKSPAGGLTFGGSATQSRGTVRSASSGLTLGGAATVLRGLARTASGGLLFSGAAPISFHSAVQQLVVNPVGGLLLRGSAAVARSVRNAAVGGITFAGHAVSSAGAAGSFLASLLPIFRRRRRR